MLYGETRCRGFDSMLGAFGRLGSRDRFACRYCRYRFGQESMPEYKTGGMDWRMLFVSNRRRKDTPCCRG